MRGRNKTGRQISKWKQRASEQEREREKERETDRETERQRERGQNKWGKSEIRKLDF